MDAYRDDPNWIPPLRGSQKEMVNYRPHPFYDRNLCQTFLAYRDGEVCGRIAAILNQGHIAQHNDRRGFFGFFDCLDDQEAANGLFDAVRQWFAEQDIHRLRGPTNPSLNYELGLLIDGFDSPPTFMMTYNPPYYERLIENYGFRKTQDLYAFWGHVDMLPEIAAKLAPIAEQIIERYDVKLRTLDRSRFQQDVEMFLDLYNRSLVNTWGFVPMSAGEVKQLAGELKKIIVPEMAVCAEVDGRVVGAAFGLPDYNPRIKEIDGRLFPFGFIHLLRNRRAIKRIRLISTNVLPEYQRMGVGLVLMQGLVPKAMEWGLEEGEFSWVLESNRLSYGALKKGGAKITKTYRLYDLDEAERGEGRGESGEGQNDECGMMNDELTVRKPDCLALITHHSSFIIVRPLPSKSARCGTPRRSRSVHQAALADLCRRPALGAAAVDRGQGVSQPPQASFLPARRRDAVHRASAAARRWGESWSATIRSYNQERGENVGCFRNVRVRRRPGGGPRSVGRGRRLARGSGPDRHPRPDRLLAQLSVRAVDRRVRHAAADHDEPQSPLLRRTARIVGTLRRRKTFTHGGSSTRAIWRRSGVSRAERLARRGNITIRPFRLDDFQAEVEPLPGGLQRRDERSLGLCQADRRRIPILRQATETHGPGRPGAAGGDRGPDRRFLDHAARHERSDSPAERPADPFWPAAGLLELLRRKRHIKTARMVVLDVLKEYRRRGIAEMLILQTLDYGKNVLGYTAAELGWTFEDNDWSTAPSKPSAPRYKTYRIYEKELTPAG